MDPAVLATAVNLFPARADQILGPLTLTLTIQATNYYRRLAAENPAAYEPDLAMSLNNLSDRLAEAGRRAERL